MKKSNLKVIKIGKVLFNYEKKILIKDLTLDLKLGYFDFEKNNKPALKWFVEHEFTKVNIFEIKIRC